LAQIHHQQMKKLHYYANQLIILEAIDLGLADKREADQVIDESRGQFGEIEKLIELKKREIARCSSRARKVKDTSSSDSQDGSLNEREANEEVAIMRGVHGMQFFRDEFSGKRQHSLRVRPQAHSQHQYSGSFQIYADNNFPSSTQRLESIADDEAQGRFVVNNLSIENRAYS